MSTPEFVPAPAVGPAKKMSRGKKAGLIGGGVLAGLVIIGVAAGGGDDTPAPAPVAVASPTSNATREALAKIQVCIDMTAGTRAYDPALWDTAVCGEYKGSLGDAGQPTTEATTEATTGATTEPVAEAATEPVAEPTPEPASDLTAAQENAVEKAADYLETGSFSRSGLISQLKFEGFTTAQATYGAKKAGL
ncbi:Ltp family lipoprotein [Actinoplanes sp. NPDC049596]|uniref:Ltp family lipoprotein n=1 Tax=unclassified Actinoplanes TaxID=2626549 RepID=UPI003442A8D9